MDTGLQSLINLYQVPSGRAVFAMRKAAEAAEARGELPLLARAKTAQELATATRDLELRFRLDESKPLYGPRAAEIDAIIDRTISALSQTVSGRLAIAQDAPESDPVRAAAERLDRDLLPRGVAYVTSLSFVEEHESVSLLIARLVAPGDLAEAATLLGLAPFIERLTALNADFGPELASVKPSTGPTWDQIRGARTRHQGALLAYVATVLGAHPDDTDADTQARAALLGPIMVQQEALAALYKSRRGVQDVDPTTGIEDPTTLSLPA